MKILRLTPYISVDKFGTNNRTGFGRTCWDLTRNWDPRDKQILLTTFSVKKTHKIDFDNIHILPISILRLLMFFRIRDFINAIKIINKYKSYEKINKRILKIYIKFIVSFSTKKFVESVIKKYNPDIVHIHGLSIDSVHFLDVVRNSKIPYIINIHGIISDTNPNYPFIPDLERNILESLKLNNDYLISISSGMIKYINKTWFQLVPDNYTVIINGTSVKDRKVLLDHEKIDRIRKKFGNQYERILISVGSITIDKGQRRIIDGFAHIDRDTTKSTLLLIIGDGPDLEYCEKLVNMYNLEKNVMFLGYIENEKLFEFYSMSSLLVQASSGPGFSRMYWEAMSVGVPTMACKLQPGITDIYNENCMLLSNTFNAEDIGKTIETALKRTWDREFISNYPNNFDWKSRTKLYKEEFEKILLRYSNTSTVKTNFFKDLMSDDHV